MKRIVSGLMIVVWLGTIVGGCNQSPSTASVDLKHTTENSENETQKAWILEDGSAKQSVLNENLTSPAVAAFADTLASWGYSYRPQSSVVTIARYLDEASTADIPILQKKYSDLVEDNLLIRQDTLLWQVFENPAFDSSKHTAVITDCRNGKRASIFVEVDISTDSLNLIRGWVLGSDGSMTTPEFNRLWQEYGECILLCCAVCAVMCWLSGPGWAACWCGCCMMCYPGCMLKLVFGRIIALFN